MTVGPADLLQNCFVGLPFPPQKGMSTQFFFIIFIFNSLLKVQRVTAETVACVTTNAKETSFLFHIANKKPLNADNFVHFEQAMTLDNNIRLEITYILEK